MQFQEHRSQDLARQDLEDAWRIRSEVARERYQTARARYRELLDAKPEELNPPQDDPLALARHAKSEALAEYTRILKLFTELTMHGRVPEEDLAASAAGGRE
jgi:hypothetical protein